MCSLLNLSELILIRVHLLFQMVQTSYHCHPAWLPSVATVWNLTLGATLKSIPLYWAALLTTRYLKFLTSLSRSVSFLQSWARLVFQEDKMFNLGLRLRLYGEPLVAQESYDATKSCSYTSWASREILCDRNYMEVNDHLVSSLQNNAKLNNPNIQYMLLWPSENIAIIVTVGHIFNNLCKQFA